MKATWKNSKGAAQTEYAASYLGDPYCHKMLLMASEYLQEIQVLNTNRI